MTQTDTIGKVEATRGELASLLAFYAESGLDFPISDVAPNHFETPPPVTVSAVVADRARPDAKPVERRPAPPPAAATIPDTQAIALANSAAAQAASLDELAALVAAFEGCNLKRTARATVFDAGNREANLMIIQAAPARDDDAQGAALSGAQGRLLKAMLSAIGLDASADCYFGFCAPWCPPGGADPTEFHLNICRPFLERQIALSNANHILVLGNIPAQQILKTRESILHVRGKWKETEIAGRPLSALATHHPSVLLNEPGMKRHAWHDLLVLKEKLSTIP